MRSIGGGGPKRTGTGHYCLGGRQQLKGAANGIVVERRKVEKGWGRGPRGHRNIKRQRRKLGERFITRCNGKGNGGSFMGGERPVRKKTSRLSRSTSRMEKGGFALLRCACTQKGRGKFRRTKKYKAAGCKTHGFSKRGGGPDRDSELGLGRMGWGA